MSEDDDLISAMWRSLVPSGYVEPSTVDHRNPHEMVVEKDITIFHAEPADHCVSVHVNYEEDVEPINHWNEQQMIVHDQYQVPEAEKMQVPIKSELVYYAPDPGIEPIDYEWNQYVMANGYSEAGAYAEEAIKDHHMVRPLDLMKKLSNNVPTQAADAAADQDIQSDNHLHQLQDDESSKSVKIFRAPTAMRKGNEDSYDPKAVSIGPYHFKLPCAENLDDAEYDKWESLDKLRRYTMFSMSKCFKKMDSMAEEVKQCYGEDKEKWPWDRLEMILDACFILVGFHILPSRKIPLKAYKVTRLKRPPPDGRPKFEQNLRDLADVHEQPNIEPPINLPFESVSVPNFTHDICLLENQIPFCLLEAVYDIAVGAYKEKLQSLRRQIVEYLHTVLMQQYPSAITIDSDDDIPHFEHILDYYHKYFAPSDVLFGKGILSQTSFQQTHTMDNAKILNKWHRATELKEAGVRFKNTEDRPRQSLLDIKFRKGELEIPTLVIDGQTRTLFRNIIAFEQKIDRYSGSNNPSEWSKNYFATYVKFMGNLLTTQEDVVLLARKGIIVNHLGDDKNVSDLFNKLMEGVNIKPYQSNYLISVYFELDGYCKSYINTWMADLKQKYFKTPWVFLGSVAGITLLICAIIGAVYNIKNKK